jgi:hypothetical protein
VEQGRDEVMKPFLSGIVFLPLGGGLAEWKDVGYGCACACGCSWMCTLEDYEEGKRVRGYKQIDQ